MSELTSCNYCQFRGYQRHAKKNGQRIMILANAKNSGIDVFRLNKGEYMPQYPDKEWREAHFVAWFMKLGSSCGC